MMVIRCCWRVDKGVFVWVGLFLGGFGEGRGVWLGLVDVDWEGCLFCFFFVERRGGEVGWVLLRKEGCCCGC